MLFPKQNEWLRQDRKKAKTNRSNILATKKRQSNPSVKPAKCLEPAMASQKLQISSLTAQNQKIITALIASGIKIPDSDPSSDKDNGEECNMAANRKNSNLTKTIRGRN